MKDMIPKATGDSRFLRSSVPANITHETLVALFRSGKFPVDFNGLNASGIAVVGSAYNKANVLPDDTCNELELDSTIAEPKDAFEHAALPEYSLRVGDIFKTTRPDFPAWFYPCDGRYIDPHTHQELDAALRYRYGATLKQDKRTLCMTTQTEQKAPLHVDTYRSNRYVCLGLYLYDTNTKKSLESLPTHTPYEYHGVYAQDTDTFILVYYLRSGKSGSYKFTFYAVYFTASDMSVLAEVKMYGTSSGKPDIIFADGTLFVLDDYYNVTMVDVETFEMRTLELPQKYVRGLVKVGKNHIFLLESRDYSGNASNQKNISDGRFCNLYGN